MTICESTLGRIEARSVCDRFGARRDRRGWYGNAALERVLAHGAFERARSVAELGCGTGRFAELLLADRLPVGARYLGVELNPTMAGLAELRLARFGNRAQVDWSDGGSRLPLAGGAADRFVSNYLLDLLSAVEIQSVLAEAWRVLAPGGRLCVAGVTDGSTVLSRLVSGLWGSVQRLWPRLVGGCRPVRVGRLLDPNRWRPLYHETVVAWGVPSEVLVASRRR